MEKQVTSTPPPPPPPRYLKMGGGSGYLYLHYLPPVDREPAINVDMVNYGLDIIVRYDKTVMCYFMSRHETSKFFI